MAREFGGDLYDLDNMTDEELYDLVLQQLGEYPNLDTGWMDIRVEDGFVTLSGRVGTAEEVQVAEQVIHDIIGIQSYSNELVVDELHRDYLPEAADAAVAAENAVQGQFGEPNPNQSDTAEHLVQDLETQTYGTHDMQEAIRDGTAYSPPDRPVADGYNSGEAH